MSKVDDKKVNSTDYTRKYRKQGKSIRRYKKESNTKNFKLFIFIYTFYTFSHLKCPLFFIFVRFYVCDTLYHNYTILRKNCIYANIYMLNIVLLHNHCN